MVRELKNSKVKFKVAELGKNGQICLEKTGIIRDKILIEKNGASISAYVIEETIDPARHIGKLHFIPATNVYL